MQILKISGGEIDQPDFLDSLAEALAHLDEATVVVHGGGKEITKLQDVFGIKPTYVDGLRISDEESLALVKMVLCGAVNTRIVEILQRRGIEAQGLSGLDRGLIRARKLEHPGGDLGRVGEVISVRGDVIIDLVEQGIIPVIAPICLGDDGAFNVNADHVAGAVGAALNASRVVFLTGIGGVLYDGKIIPVLTADHAETLISKGVIVDGMIPKVRTALDVLRRGAQQVLITSLDGLQTHTGTAIVLKED
ncbi:MAG TPA: acetylglutamate kinase [Aggregatilineales bacterium]|nr:acetylglutamate kinase [Aggregatilineales bacterium]